MSNDNNFPEINEDDIAKDMPNNDLSDFAPSNEYVSSDPKKKSKGKGIIIGIIAVAAILIIACLCVYVFAPQVVDKIFNSTALTRGDDVVLTIGDFDISTKEYNYYMYPIRVEGEVEDPNYWKTHIDEGEKVKESALDMLRGNYAMLQWAKDVGLELSDEEKAEAAKAIDDIKGSYATEAEFYAALEENYLTVDIYTRLYEQKLMFNKLYEYVFSNSELSEVTEEDAKAYAVENGYMGAKHILILLTGDEAVDKEKLAFSQDILQQLKAGANFDEMMDKYTEDPGIASYPDGYTFGAGEMVAVFEEAVKALEVGAMSEIVESDKGYHIILRTEPDSVQMIDTIINERATQKIEEYREKMEIKYSRGYDKITLDQVTWDFPAVEGLESPDAEQKKQPEEIPAEPEEQ